MFINKKTNAFIILILYILIDFIEIIKKKNKYNDGKKFIDKCLIDKNIKNYNIAYQFPLLSIIIPAFNCEKTIQFPISSIQNQNISTFEIILINAFGLLLKIYMLGNLHIFLLFVRMLIMLHNNKDYKYLFL